MLVCGWRRSLKRKSTAAAKQSKTGLCYLGGRKKKNLSTLHVSCQVQENPCPHLTLSRLPEWRVHQHHPPSSEEAEILHGKETSSSVVLYKGKGVGGLLPVCVVPVQ